MLHKKVIKKLYDSISMKYFSKFLNIFFLYSTNLSFFLFQKDFDTFDKTFFI